jgi:hypothetical protein
MAHSEVSISNIALAKLGTEAIRSFSENNKRARMSEALFESTKDDVLASYDWTFARGLKSLRELTAADIVVFDGERAFALPSDCKVPIAIHPRVHKIRWEVRDGALIVPSSLEEVYLYYTRNVNDTSTFSDGFVQLVAHRLAILLGPSITRDNTLIKDLKSDYPTMEMLAWEVDANIGNEYRAYDSRPEDDTFVNPDGAIQEECKPWEG